MKKSPLGTVLGLFLSALFFTFTAISCSKSADPPASPPPPPPAPPTIAWTQSPTGTLNYGDTVSVSYTSTNAGGTNGTIGPFRPLKDTVVTASVTGAGGAITSSWTVKVGPPSAKVLLLTKGYWKIKSKEFKSRVDGNWYPYILNACEIPDHHTFYLDFTFYDEHGCFPNVPPGFGYGNWNFALNETKLYWGGVIDPVTKAKTYWDILQLDDHTLQLFQTIKVIDISTGKEDGTLDTRITYYR